MTIRYLIAVVLSALLLSHFHGKPTLTNSVAHYAKPIQTAKAVQPQQETTAAVETPKPQVTEASYATGCSTYDSIFRQYAWDVRTAEAICMAESGGNPYAVSNPRLNYDGVSDYGLMQIHAEAIYNPSANIARAHQKYLTQGWYAWSTYTSGAYYRYL